MHHILEIIKFAEQNRPWCCSWSYAHISYALYLFCLITFLSSLFKGMIYWRSLVCISVVEENTQLRHGSKIRAQTWPNDLF